MSKISNPKRLEAVILCTLRLTEVGDRHEVAYRRPKGDTDGSLEGTFVIHGYPFSQFPQFLMLWVVTVVTNVCSGKKKKLTCLEKSTIKISTICMSHL